MSFIAEYIFYLIKFVVKRALGQNSSQCIYEHHVPLFSDTPIWRLRFLYLDYRGHFLIVHDIHFKFSYCLPYIDR